MTKQFERELSDSIQRMREAISPYTRFVRVEREKLEQVASRMEETRGELAKLRAVNAAVNTPPNAPSDAPSSATANSI